MKMTDPKVSCIAALLLIPAAFAMKEASASATQVGQGHLSGLTARITLPDGTIRLATIGLGCTASICSRVAIKGKADGDALARFWLDSIAVIRDTTEKDALLVMKNGAAQRVSLVTDFRVLYFANESRKTEKVDLAKVKSLEFQKEK